MMRWTSGRYLLTTVLLGALLAVPRAAEGQFQRGGFGGGGNGARREPDKLWGLPPVRVGFSFCRLMFDTVRRDDSGSGWKIEYPRADQNFMTRLAQLTVTPINEWGDGPPGYPQGYWPGYPGHTMVQATDPEIFQCPFVMMSSPGTVGFTGPEVSSLRDYLLKGGFLWGDDFWGNASWNHWVNEIGRVLPGYPIVELIPNNPEHTVFSTFYDLQEVPQIPSLNRFGRMGYNSTSEMGAESAHAGMYAIFDPQTGRPLVLMTHNTDIADGWEREADLEIFFQRFAWLAYAVGVNVMVWSMTR